MKTSLLLSALLTVIAVGCGSAPDASVDASEAKDSPLSLRSNGPLTCTFQTINGRYLTAVGGGNRTSDVLHTDATRVGSWERFTLLDSRDGSSPINYGIITYSGRYLTAVGGGGRITDVIHSDATRLLGWEKFALHSLGGGYYAIQTANGHYLTANGGGGQIVDAIHSDATVVQAWEKFRVSCTNP